MEKIYIQKIVVICHGYSGEGFYGPELVGDSKLVGNEVTKTVGNYWPIREDF